MSLIALKAYFDGDAIRLNEAIVLPTGTEVIVILNDPRSVSSGQTFLRRPEGTVRPLRTIVWAGREAGDEDEPTALAYTPDEFFGEPDDNEEDDASPRS